MYDPFRNPDGSDSEYGQLHKTDRNPVQESRYQELKRQADLNDPVKQAQRVMDDNNRRQSELAAKQKAETDARFATAKQEIGNYNTAYASAVPQVFNQVFDKFKIPEQTDAVNALNSRIQDLKGNLSGGASGYASGAQVDKAINTNYLPNFGIAVSNLNNSIAAGKSQFDAFIDPIRMQGQMMMDRIAMEMAGYDNNQQRELQGLISVLQINGNLTAQQWEIADRLAERHMKYELSLKKLQQDRELEDRAFEENKRRFELEQASKGSGGGLLPTALSGIWGLDNTSPSTSNADLSKYVFNDDISSGLGLFGGIGGTIGNYTQTQPSTQKKSQPWDYRSTFQF